MDAPSELATDIVRNIVPLNAGQDIAPIYQPAENTVMRLLNMLGIGGGGGQPQGYTPKLNEPLPQKDPRTGQMIYPQGYRGPR